jgi:pyruvate dehydrogenase E1 component alpha subunit
MPGVRVDGNDVLAVYAVTKRATQRAHRGEGPTLIEALTYRIGPHSTADDATRYRVDAEVDAWRRRDPIGRFRAWLVTNGLADEAFVTSCDEEAAAWVAEVRAGITSLPDPSAGELTRHAYARPPWPEGEDA